MKLPQAPAKYDQADQARTRGAIERETDNTYRRGSDIVLSNGQRLVIPDETTGVLYRLKVTGGVLSLVAYP